MRHPSLPATFHAANRARLAETIGPEAIAIIDTADVLTRAGDYEYPFRPDSNFYYLTGIAEPEAVLVLAPGQSQKGARELLFISGTSEFVATWEGERLTPEQAARLSGIKTVLPLSELDGYLSHLLDKYHTIYLNAEESLASIMPSPAKRRATALREKLPLRELRSALPTLARQRTLKDPVEIEQLRHAIGITRTGLEAAYRSLKPGLYEDQLEAELTAEFLRAGSTHAFQPIVAAGANTTVLHHMHNNGRAQNGDLVLFDVGAESAYYAADISRTLPVNGRFNARQRAVYEAVHRTQAAAIAMLRPGLHKRPYEEHVAELLTDELQRLGFKNPDLRTFFPHSTSHFLGLDLHDVGDYSRPLEPGMVLTVEPGLYLREEGIGVRIEDDVLITEQGCEVLSRHLPSDPDEMETRR